MASAIPAAVGLGSSLIGGISGKGAAKEQRKLAERLLEMNRPFLQHQLDLSGMAVDAVSRNLNPLLASLTSSAEDADRAGDRFIGDYDALLTSALPYLRGAAGALADLQRFYRPFMYDGARAIDGFLPSSQRTFETLAPEIGNINQGYQSASDAIARFAPRGGGRVSSLAKADLDRQKQISDQFFAGRQALADKALGAAFQGAKGQQDVASALQALGLGQAGLAQGAAGLGLSAKNLGLSNRQVSSNVLQSLFGVPTNTGGTVANLYNAQANRAAYPQQRSGKGIGDYLVDLFSDKKVQDKIGGIFSKIF